MLKNVVFFFNLPYRKVSIYSYAQLDLTLSQRIAQPL